MTDEPVWETEKGVMIRVVVKPNSKERNLISEITPDAVHVNLKSQARGGKANKELLKQFAKLLRLSTSDILIVAGQKSREKTLLVIEGTAEDVRKMLSL